VPCRRIPVIVSGKSCIVLSTATPIAIVSTVDVHLGPANPVEGQ